MPGWSAQELLGAVAAGEKPEGFCGITFDGEATECQAAPGPRMLIAFDDPVGEVGGSGDL